MFTHFRSVNLLDERIMPPQEYLSTTVQDFVLEYLHSLCLQYIVFVKLRREDKLLRPRILNGLIKKKTKKRNHAQVVSPKTTT